MIFQRHADRQPNPPDCEREQYQPRIRRDQSGFTARYYGFVNGDNASVLVGAPNLATSATTNSPVGNYAIINTNISGVGSLSATNYFFSAINFTNGDLAVSNRAADSRGHEHFPAVWPDQSAADVHLHRLCERRRHERFDRRSGT